MKTINNYWAGGTPFGGGLSKSNPPSARNINGYLAPIPLQRVKQDPQTWKESLMESEVPMPMLSYRVKVQQMYMDAVNDGHVWACMERRKDLVLLKDYCIVDENDIEDKEATKLIQAGWFKEIISHTLDAKYYGYTLLGIGDIINGKPSEINLLRRANISPDRLNICQVPYMPSGIDFMNPEAKDSQGNSFYDWTIWIPSPSDFGISKCGYGLLYKVALYQILLRNNLGDNSTYNELFGMPLRVGKTEKKDLVERNKLAASLDNMGSSAWMVLDTEDQVEFHEASGGSGKGNSTYDNFEQRLEKKISKVILGHEDALSSTPGRLGSQGKDVDSIGKALIDKEKHDTSDCEAALNDYVIPKLIKLGFRIPIGKTLKFKNDKEKEDTRLRQDTNNTATAGMVKTFSDAGLKVDEAYITERTGIPLAKVEVKEPLIVNPNVTQKTLNKIKSYYGG
jgi:phage gp29-like protein